MNTVEIWKPVKGFEDSFEVSALGRVKSISRSITFIHRGTPTTKIIEGVIKKPQKKLDGYLSVQLKVFGSKAKTITIHRLVAIHFISNPKNKKTVNHKNGIKTDNRVENLEWATRSENTQHAYDTGLKIPIKGGKHYKAKKVIDTETKEVFAHVREAALKNGLIYSTLTQYLNGNRPNITTLKYL